MSDNNNKNDGEKSCLDGHHAQRLETLGLLASGVAHDFNNILAGILGHVTYLRNILPASGPHNVSLQSIEDGAKKASLITQQILNFSRLEQNEQTKQVNMCELIKKTCNLLRGAISPQFELTHSVPDETIHVLGVEAKLAQILVNLAVNARDALESEGCIRVELITISDVARLKSLFGSSELPCKRYATLRVIDNGHGMSAEIQRRIFEPYFSTKQDRGTGLGMAMVAAIVRELGGATEVESRPGKGTTISVHVPILEEASIDAVSSSAPPVALLSEGEERILVIDDEYPVRNVLSLSLQHLGYEVEVAVNGLEGLDKYPKTRYDLVILDMLMPHLSGEQVFFKLKELDPNVRVLVISGYTSESVMHNILAHGGLEFIQKPFTIEELSRRVRDCLAIL